MATSTIENLYPPCNEGRVTGPSPPVRQGARVLGLLLLALVTWTQHGGAKAAAPDAAVREGARLLVLHTNALHNQVRADAGGIGAVVGFVSSAIVRRAVSLRAPARSAVPLCSRA
jgi:hypothetical protein